MSRTRLRFSVIMFFGSIVVSSAMRVARASAMSLCVEEQLPWAGQRGRWSAIAMAGSLEADSATAAWDWRQDNSLCGDKLVILVPTWGLGRVALGRVGTYPWIKRFPAWHVECVIHITYILSSYVQATYSCVRASIAMSRILDHVVRVFVRVVHTCVYSFTRTPYLYYYVYPAGVVASQGRYLLPTYMDTHDMELLGRI